MAYYISRKNKIEQDSGHDVLDIFCKVSKMKDKVRLQFVCS